MKLTTLIYTESEQIVIDIVDLTDSKIDLFLNEKYGLGKWFLIGKEM